jgi:hypothetical protein
VAVTQAASTFQPGWIATSPPRLDPRLHEAGGADHALERAHVAESGGSIRSDSDSFLVAAIACQLGHERCE